MSGSEGLFESELPVPSRLTFAPEATVCGAPALATALAPAIGYARNGYPVVERISATIGMVEALFREHWPTSAAIYLLGGRIPEPGSIFANPKLAEYLNALSAKLDDATMARLNASVDVDKKTVEDVARTFLKEQGLV